MAVSTNSYFNNAIVGTPQAGYDTKVYDTHSSAKFAIGTKFERQDGSIFRYVHFGEAVDAGVLVAQDISESTKEESLNSLVAPGSAIAVPNETISAGKIGSRYIEASISSITADQFAGGYICLSSDTSEGYIYRIKGNTAVGNPNTLTERFELYDALVSAIDATTDCILIGNRYANLEIATTTDSTLAGVTMRVQGASAYGWVQTKGIACILTDETGGFPTVGTIVTLSDSVSGAVQAQGGGDESANAEMISEPLVGFCIVPSQGKSGGVYSINLE